MFVVYRTRYVVRVMIVDGRLPRLPVFPRALAAFGKLVLIQRLRGIVVTVPEGVVPTAARLNRAAEVMSGEESGRVIGKIRRLL